MNSCNHAVPLFKSNKMCGGQQFSMTLFLEKRSGRLVDGWLVVLLFYVHSKHLRSCWDGQLT